MKTQVAFPLVWASQRKDVYAENVTDRYTNVPAPKDQKDKKQPQGKSELSVEQIREIEKEAGAYFSTDTAATWKFDVKLDQLLAANDDAIRGAVWKAFVAAPLHADMQKDFKANQVRYQQHVSPYVVRKVGERPKNGWPLVIAMHGGGNAPQATNDSQWKQMQKYYKDHPELTGYQYRSAGTQQHLEWLLR